MDEEGNSQRDEGMPLSEDQEKPLDALQKRRRKNTKERRDKGKKLITVRDRLVLLWIAQQYAARLDQVRELLNRMPGRGGKKISPTGLTLSAVLQVIGRWVDLGLVVFERVYDREPGWVYVTALGLRKLQLSYTMLTPADSTLPHLYNINRVRLDLEDRHPEYRWVSERALRAAQSRREEGVTLPHIPDAQIWQPKSIALEVERSPKSPKELDSIYTELLITGASLVNGEPPVIYTTIWYFVTPKARTAVEQARNRLPSGYQSRVKILSLETLKPFA
jgi:hypothetical protein